ncbi:MAG: hypothetical protein KAW88_01540 [Candidatus Cloacimonetes bacterium]|nr:hypothetical protein [Candidatus Cloacimonadota bacterium]
MAKELKEVVLFDGEEISCQLEGNAYTSSPNPLVKLMTSIFRIFWIILGIKLKTYIIITNLRIIQVDKKTILWGIIPSDTAVTTLNKRTIQSVGYTKAVRWLFFKTIYFSMSNMVATTNITYKGSLSDISEIVQKVSELVSK